MILKDTTKAFEIYSKRFHKILKVDLSNGTYESIKVKDGEEPKSPRAQVNVLAWAEEFIENYNAIEDDLEMHRLAYNLKFMRSYFETNDSFSVRYKRKNVLTNEYEWVQMLMEKSDEPNIVYLYIIDIDEHFHKELDYLMHKNLIENTDEETGLKNKQSFNRLIDNFNNRKVGLIYLKYNDIKDIIKSIENIKNDFVSGSFKVSDNEIFVICNDHSRQRFHEKYHNLINHLQELGIKCTVGKLWKEKYDSLVDLLDIVKSETWEI